VLLLSSLSSFLSFILCSLYVLVFISPVLMFLTLIYFFLPTFGSWLISWLHFRK
jgi:hypothetical protein